MGVAVLGGQEEGRVPQLVGLVQPNLRHTQQLGEAGHLPGPGRERYSSLSHLFCSGTVHGEPTTTSISYLFEDILLLV